MINTQSLRDEIVTYVTEQHNHAQFFGSILAANSDGIIVNESFGFANIELNVPNHSRTKYRIGSLTKAFTAVAILQLISQQKATLDSTLDQFIADYPEGNHITIHHLLSHTSGIHNFSNREDVMEWYKSTSSLTATIDAFKNKQLQFMPGERFEYSNSNYILLTYIIEQLSNISYEQYLQDNIFDPLEMNHTGYDHDTNLIVDRASGYYFENEVLRNVPYINMDIPQGAGGLYSTVEDMYKWDRGLRSNKLLNADMTKKMFTPNLEHYGYGWIIQQFDGHDVVFHTGGIHGFNSVMCRLIEVDVCVIAICNYSIDIRAIAVHVSKMLLD